MNKQQTKHIREIADRLPPVYEQTMSGYTIQDGKMVPYIYNVEVNHERRLRKAYERHGLDGIKSYLEMISKLQKQRNENFMQQRGGDSSGESGDNVSNPDSLAVEETQSGVSGVGEAEESSGS